MNNAANKIKIIIIIIKISMNFPKKSVSQKLHKLNFCQNSRTV